MRYIKCCYYTANGQYLFSHDCCIVERGLEYKSSCTAVQWVSVAVICKLFWISLLAYSRKYCEPSSRATVRSWKIRTIALFHAVLFNSPHWTLSIWIFAFATPQKPTDVNFVFSPVNALNRPLHFLKIKIKIAVHCYSFFICCASSEMFNVQKHVEACQFCLFTWKKASPL